MATIQTLNGAEKIKDSYTKINTSLTNLNNAKLEKNGSDAMTGDLKLGATGSYHRIIRQASSDTDVFLSLDFEGVTAAPVNVVLFRAVNTTGPKIFTIFRGDGTNMAVFRITDGAIDRLNGMIVTITAYAGNPNGNVAAPPGSLCANTNGGTGTTLYYKASGTGNTGWVAIA